jgi:hypothetical protein
MKKSLAVLFVCICFSVSAFAEYNFSFYGRGVFTPIAVSDGDSSVSAATTTYDNSSRPRIGFTLKGNNATESIGMIAMFNWDFKSGDATSLIGENANLWVKPLAPFSDGGLGNLLKITIGRFEVDDFRGRVGSGEFASWIVPEGSYDEDAIFTRFKSSAGAHITVKPLSALDSPFGDVSLEAAVGSNLGGDRAFRNIRGWNAEDVYAAAQFGIGYRIPEVGLARFQFIGNNREVYLEHYPYDDTSLQTRLAEGLSTNRDADVIEVAFLYDGVENLKAEIGAKIPLAYTTGLPNYIYYPGVYYGSYPYQTGSTNNADNLEVQLPYSVAIGASYRWNNLSVLGRVDFSFGGKYANEGKNTITVGNDVRTMVSADYRILTPLRVGLDIAYNFHGFDAIETGGKTENIGERANDKTTSERNDFGFAPWAAVDLGGGVVKVGVAVMIPSSERWTYDSSGGTHPWKQFYTGKPIISVPISVTYSF